MGDPAKIHSIFLTFKVLIWKKNLNYREKGMSLANLPQARLGRRRVPSCTTDFCSASSMLSFRLLSAEAAS